MTTNKSKCESCGAQTKELFEQGKIWVCKKCKKPSNPRGHLVKTKPPIGLGKGRIV